MKQFKIKVDGQEYTVEVEEILDENKPGNISSAVSNTKKPQPTETKKQTEIKPSQKPETKKSADSGNAEGEEIQAPMPGKVLKINVSEGDSVNLSWVVTDASTVMINQGIGNVALTGSTSVSPITTTTYTLTATNSVEPIVQYPDKEVSAPSYHKVVEINKPEEKEDEYNIPDNLKELIPNRSSSPRSLNDILGGH